MLQWYFILFFSRDHVLTMLHLAPIFFFWGGGSFYPSNILDGTLLTTVRLDPGTTVSCRLKFGLDIFQTELLSYTHPLPPSLPP